MLVRTCMLMGFALVCPTILAGELEIGAEAPDFKATGIDGKQYSLANSKEAKVTVLCFTCNQCPVAVAYEDRFIEFNKKYASKGVQFIAINCNKTENLSAMKERAEEKGFGFPYVYDGSGAAARSYGARVTPHIFVVDKNGKVAYRGAYDDKMQNPTQSHLVDAVEALLENQTPKTQSTKAFGCSIKNDLN